MINAGFDVYIVLKKQILTSTRYFKLMMFYS